MPLDPQAQKLLDIARTSGLPPLNQVAVADARTRMAKALTYTGEREPLASVQDLTIPVSGGHIRLRHYRPTGEAVLPAIVFFHGGGWVLNDLDTHDHLCRALAVQSSAAIVAVEYRLAPEYPFPTPVSDALDALRWVFNNSDELGIDSGKIGVAGDSSGGTLAAVAAQSFCASGFQLRCQVLMYPVLDHWSTDTPSYREVGVGYSLTRDVMIWFYQHYLPSEADLNDPRVCPLRAEHCAGLPPTLIMTAEFDPLRDEGEQYARRLEAAGVNVTCTRYAGMMHGFVIQYRVLDKGRQGLAEAAAFIRSHLFVRQ